MAKRPIIPLLAGLALAGTILGSYTVLRVGDTNPTPPDIVVFCEPSVGYAIADVGRLWRQKTGVPVHIFTESTASLLEQLSHGPRSDLIVGSGTALASAALDRHLVAAAPVELGWRNHLALARRGTGAAAVTLTSASDPVSLAGAKPIAVIDPPVDPAGNYGRASLTSLDLWPAVERHSIGVVGTADAAYLLAHETVDLALLYTTDIAADPGFSAAALLPEDSYPAVTYWIAATRSLQSPQAAAFVAFLKQPELRKRLEADGLEVTP